MKLGQKLKKPSSPTKLSLQEIIGLTTKNANGLASVICSSKCVYLAGCVVVVYDVDSSTQSHLVVSHRMPKPLSCVSVSQNGRFVAAGESSNLSAVLIWDCETLGFVSELKGHLYGAHCLSFSPNGEYLVSVGGYIYLWDWRRSILVAKVKASSNCSDITSVTFSPNGKFIITSGNKHLKFWTVGSFHRTRSRKVESLAFHGKSTHNGFQKEHSFVSVISATNRSDEQANEFISIYALTDAGVLMLMSNGMLIKKSVDLKVEKCYALSASSRLIACACSEGVIQLFTPETLEYAGTIHFSDAKSSDSEDLSHSEFKNLEPQPAISPDAVACQFSTTDKLVVIYRDRSLYVWDVNDVNKKEQTRWNTIYNVCLDLLNSPNTQPSFIKQQKPENFCTKLSGEQRDMLKQFDNSFSMIDEVEAEKPLQQRRYSSQFVLKRDYIGGTKQFMRTPYKTLKSIQEHRSEEHPQQEKTSSEVFHDTIEDDSLQERITYCRQALHDLNAAASVFVQSMSELSTVSPRDRISGELKDKFIDEAALMIPEMSQKVNEVVAKMMLQHKNRTQVIDNFVSG